MGLSRRTFSEGKRYTAVVFQENTHPGDFEMVELQDIQNAERNGSIKEIISDGFIGSGFLVVGAGLNNSVKIVPGAGFSQGRRIILPDGDHAVIDSYHVYNMNIATPATDRTDLVYVDVFSESVTSAQDPDILDPTLGPSASRERVRYVLRVAENETATIAPELAVGHMGYPLAQIKRRAGDPQINAADVIDARPFASLSASMRPKNVITVSPLGGDFNDPQTALESITSSGPTNQWVILLHPGVYTLTDRALAFNNSYVSLIGSGPDTCSIVIEMTVGFGLVNINADHVTIKGVKIDGSILTGGDYNIDLEDVVTMEDSYLENDTNVFMGLNATAGGTIKARNCKFYTQNYHPYAGVMGGASSDIDMDACEIVAADTDGITLAGGGKMSMRNCHVQSTRELIQSSGEMSITNCVFEKMPLKTFAISGAMVILSASVTNRVSNSKFLLTGTATDFSTVMDTVCHWENVTFQENLALTTSTGSRFVNCEFSGLDINGGAVDVIGCLLNVAAKVWGYSGTNNRPIALLLRGSAGAALRAIGCRTPESMIEPALFISGANAVVKGCHLTSSVADINVVIIYSPCNPVIDSCDIELLTAYTPGTAAILVAYTTGVLTLTHSHLHTPVINAPYFVAGIAPGTQLRHGRNTAISSLFDAATVTVVTNIGVDA